MSTITVTLTERERFLISEALCRTADLIHVTPKPYQDLEKAQVMLTLVKEKFETFTLLREEIIKIKQMEETHAREIQSSNYDETIDYGERDLDRHDEDIEAIRSNGGFGESPPEEGNAHSRRDDYARALQEQLDLERDTHQRIGEKETLKEEEEGRDGYVVDGCDDT